jgi:isopentenyl phosphate kinase
MLIRSKPEPMQSPVVVKLGGSAITDKSRTCTPRLEVIHNAITEVGSYSGQLVLLHGGGSFAHPFVSKAALRNGFRQKSQLASVSEIELNLDQLTRIIGVGLLLQHQPFVPLAPMSFMTLRGGLVSRWFLAPITEALRLGLIPLIHGDIAFDELRGCGIVSADRIASLLGEKIGAPRVLFGCDVDGLYDGNPKTSSKAELIAEVNQRNYTKVLKGLKLSSGDVTGGMRGKVMEALRLARHGCECYVFNLIEPSNLRNLLRGSSSIGTRFVPWKKIGQ